MTSLTPTDIKPLLHNWIEKQLGSSDGDIIIDELGFYNKDLNSTIDNSFRADTVLANGRLVGFEVKSEKDSLKRWQSQMTAYTNVFDEVWLLVHSKHLTKALEMTAKHVGVLLIDSYGSIAMVRQAITKGTLNNVYDMTGLLWKDELKTLANQYEIQVKSRTTKREVREIMDDKLNIEQVRPFILQRLKDRKG